VELLIDVDSKDHGPGDVVRGRLSVKDGREVRALRARLALRERSDQYRVTAWATEWETLAGAGDPPAEVDFALPLPPGAIPNPEGTNGSVRWEVEAVADRSRRFDVQARMPVSVVSDGNVRSPQAEEQIEGRKSPRQSRRKALRSGKLWTIAALVLAALGIPLVVLGFLVVNETIGSQDPGEGWALVLVGGISAAIAPPIWLIGARWLQATRSKGLRLTVDPQRPRRGEVVRIDLSGSDGGALRAGPTVVLELIELSDVDQEVGGQRTRTTVESSRWRTETPVDGGNPVVELEIPTAEPFSYPGSCRSYLWRVAAREARAGFGRRHPPVIEEMIWVDP
jgi:hypothetical protein